MAAGDFERVSRGFYRLREFPSSSHEDVIAAWVKTSTDRPAAVQAAARLTPSVVLPEPPFLPPTAKTLTPAGIARSACHPCIMLTY